MNAVGARYLSAYLDRRLRIPDRIGRMLDMLLGLVSGGRLQVAPLRSLTDAIAAPLKPLRAPITALAHDPVRLDSVAPLGPAVHRLPGTPTAGYRIIRDATVAGQSTSVLVRNGLLVPEATVHSRHEVRIEGPHVVLRGRDANLLRVPRRGGVIPSGLFLGGRGVGNWYHFLVEVAPRLMLRGELPTAMRDVPLLVPEETLAAGPARRLIELLAPDATVVALPADAVVRVSALLWIDIPVRSPYKLDRWVDIRPEHEALDIGFFREFRAHVLMTLGLASGTPTLAPLLLDRGPHDARPYNRDEVLSLGVDHGFEPVDLGSLPLEGQLTRVLGSSMVLGPHGAAWTNILFASPGTRGLSLTPQHRRVTGFSGFQNLAAVADVELRDLVMASDGGRSRVDLERLSSALVRMLDPARPW